MFIYSKIMVLSGRSGLMEDIFSTYYEILALSLERSSESALPI